MERNDFYNVAKEGTIRERVAEFMEHNPMLSKLKDKAWYDMEDAICWFIEDNDELIFRFKDREYMAEDVKCYLEQAGYHIPNDDVLSEMTLLYDDKLGDSDLYADARASVFDYVLSQYEDVLLSNEHVTMNDLLQKAASLGLFDVEISKVDDSKRNCLWHGGDVASWKYIYNGETLKVYVQVCGDVIATLYKGQDEIVYSKDKNNDGMLSENIAPYIHSDSELLRAIDNFSEGENDKSTYRLQLHNNNWVEYTVYNETTGKWVGPDMLDNIADSDDIYDAIGEIMNEDFPAFIDEFEKEVM